MIRPYSSDVINDHKTRKNLRVHSSNEVIDYKIQYGEWKIQLTMSINFTSSKDPDETSNMYTISDNTKLIMSSETNDITEEPCKYLLQKYQEGLEESMKGSQFIFDSVDLISYKLQKQVLTERDHHIDSPEWLENKKAIINPRNNDDKCFQYALTATLNHQNIKKVPQRISKVKRFINQYGWKEIYFPSHSKD